MLSYAKVLAAVAVCVCFISNLVLTSMLFLIYLQWCFAKPENDICRLFKDGTQLRKPGTCQEYITCRNQTSVLAACPSNKLFDHKKKTCVDAATLSSDSYCNHSCKGKHEYWISDLTSCHGFHYCSDGEGQLSRCPEKYHFAEDLQMCIHDHDSMCIDVQNICDVVPNGVKFRNEKNCKAWYECKTAKDKNVLDVGACSDKLNSEYFDVDSQKCVKKHMVSCEAHPIPKDVCGTDGKAEKNKFVSDQASCRGYFYCADLGYVADVEPVWGRCPEGKFFDAGTEECKEPHLVACAHNRCEGRGTRLVESSDNDCHNYWVCENGMPAEPKDRQCVGEFFFNSEIEACTPHIIDYPSCDYCALNNNKC